MMNVLQVESVFRRSSMEKLSRGVQQKITLAQVLLPRQKLLQRNEPPIRSGPRSKREVQAEVRERRTEHGTTILFTTHDMTEADTFWDRIVIQERTKKAR
jgi:ABC-2 type transport system ATP-binding protein